MQTKFAVVVLNYKKYDETIECVDSLLKQKNVQYEIVIVDNGSNNQSVEILKEIYGNNKSIHILETNENLGFARGNNVGIHYSRKVLQCDFCMILNSDTIIYDEQLLFKAKIAYKKGIGVLNFKCIDMDGQPLYPSNFGENIYYRFVIRVPRDIILYKTKRHRVFRIEPCKDYAKFGCYSISGCAYILTPDFFEHYSQLYPGTFLYNEEDALAVYLKKADIKSIIVETVPILHKLHGSTEIDILKTKNMKKFIIRNKLKTAYLVFLSKRIIQKKYS